VIVADCVGPGRSNACGRRGRSIDWLRGKWRRPKVRALEITGETRSLDLLLTPLFARWSLVIFLYGLAFVAEGTAGADTNRAAIPHHAGRRFGAFRCAYGCRVDPIPRRVQGTGTTSLPRIAIHTGR
jgi:hypothetical protein